MGWVFAGWVFGCDAAWCIGLSIVLGFGGLFVGFVTIWVWLGGWWWVCVLWV